MKSIIGERRVYGDKSKELLLNTYLTILQIGEQVGYKYRYHQKR